MAEGGGLRQGIDSWSLWLSTPGSANTAATENPRSGSIKNRYVVGSSSPTRSQSPRLLDYALTVHQTIHGHPRRVGCSGLECYPNQHQLIKIGIIRLVATFRLC